MTLVQDNSVQAINTALLSIKRDISASTTTTAGTTAGLEPGKTYNINISGNAETATTAKTARTATNANRAETAETATNATRAETATTAETATKAVEVIDYGDTSKTVKVGYNGPGVTADKLLHLAGYTERDDSSVKLKDVNKGEIIKWLGIPRIKYADYRTGDLTFNSVTDQKGIELSNFGPDVTEDNVLSFMVIWWTGVIITASGDWAKSQGTSSSGLKCALHALQAGTGQCVIRCVYMV